MTRLFRKERHTCPRRVEGPQYDVKNQDYWYKRDGYRSCNYCGSMHPDDFMSAIHENIEIGPTDKNYKVYVEYLHAGKMCHNKFYFQHLNDEQKQYFVGLVNAKRIKFGYPGHLYTMPFFMRPA